MYINRRELIKAQKHKEKFSRFDIVVRSAYLDSIGTPKYGLYKALYNKMQILRTGHACHTNGIPWVEQFLLLDRSFCKNGYIDEYPLVVNDDLHLINSSHRASLCLHHKIDKIPINISDDWLAHLENKGLKTKTYFDYGIGWFRDNGFSDKELKMIIDSKNSIFEELGLYFYVILWPPAAKYFKDILRDISNNHEVISSKQIDFGKDFDSIVREIYQIDNIEEWKLNKKINSMKNSSNDTSVMVIKLDLFGTKFRRKTKFPDCEISLESEAIKKKIRDKYKDKIDKYFYDIIIHMSDNYDHVNHINQTFKRYKLED